MPIAFITTPHYGSYEDANKLSIFDNRDKIDD